VAATTVRRAARMVKPFMLMVFEVCLVVVKKIVRKLVAK
jgi:hypothetical protein